MKIFVLIFLAVSSLSVALLSDNWNSRFLMPILPLIFLLGGGELAAVQIFKTKKV